MPTSNSPRRHAPPAERRAQILGAALDCFSDKGYHAATMDDLVRASGLSKGSLYWHFDSKQEVFLAVVDLFALELFAGWRAVAAESGDALETLRRFGELAVGLLGGQPKLLGAWAEFFSHRDAREKFAGIYRQSRQMLAAVLREGVARGELRELPVESAAAALTALVEGLLLQAVVDPQFDPRRHWPVLWALARRGIEA